ncbi:hypothetical protein M422DRAFT_172138, partial [Sphaerobolus stellatus SS14]
LRGMVRKSILGTPSEYDAYGVITEAFILHKQPRERYTFFPQLYLPWNPHKPKDSRGSIPDFGLGRYCQSVPYVCLQGGVEVKKASTATAHLPPANEAYTIDLLQRSIHLSVPQAEDQAKAAVKGKLLPPDRKLSWLIFVGPYFTCIQFGPFTPAQLQTCGHKPNDSGDWEEAAAIELSKQNFKEYIIYRLGDLDAAAELE